MMRVLALLLLALFSAALASSLKQYDLPSLPYSYDAMEPYIDAETMRIHHEKHHGAYTKNLNAALNTLFQSDNEDAKRLGSDNTPLLTLLRNVNQLPESVRAAVRNNGGGFFNHLFFWSNLRPPVAGQPNTLNPDSALHAALVAKFESVAQFKEQFSKAAASVFGSGWAWLVVDSKTKELVLLTTPNQDTPVMINPNYYPLVGLDVWEHAYYLKYRNVRADYIASFWEVVHWDMAEKAFKAITMTVKPREVRDEL